MVLQGGPRSALRGAGGALLALATWALAQAAGAEPPAADGVRVDQLQPASPESPFLRVEAPHAPQQDRVEFAAGVTLDYGLRPVEAAEQDENGETVSLGFPVRHALLAHVGGSLTPLHWLSFDINVPFGLVVTGDELGRASDGAHVRHAESPGVGDIRLGGHVRPIDRLDLGLILGGRVWPAIGSENAYLSDKRVRAEIDIGVAGEEKQYLWGCMAFIGPGFFGQRNGDRVAAACALHAKLAPEISAGIEPLFSVFADEGTLGTDYRVQLEPMAAGRLELGDFRVGLAAGPGIGDASGVPSFRSVLRFAYVGRGEPEKPPPPPPPDADLDKILDKDDACPREAGPDNTDPTKRGCPSQDRDADGVRDDEDWCPDRGGIRHENPNANGCPDSDNDTLPDPIDTCRNEPGVAPQGCPKFARLQTDTFKVDPPIDFEPRSPNLTATSRSAIEEIAATMRANANLEQVSFTLGTKGVRAELSDKRAQQIILVLRMSNLSSERYEVVLQDDLKAGIIEIRVHRP
jgi:hypothetical protein